MAEFATLDDLLNDPDPLDLVVRKRGKDGKYAESTLRVYPRRPTDTIKELCTGAANAARRRLRATLNDEKSEEHKLLLVEPLEEADEEGLRRIWVQGQLIEAAAGIQMNSLEEREVVPEPDEGIVLPKERDQYDEAVQAAENDRMVNLLKALDAEQKRLTREAEAIPRKALIDAAKPAHIETIVAKEWNNVYTTQIISRCTYNDKGYNKPTFKTTAEVEKFRERYPSAYRLLADTHRGLLMEMEPSLGN